jgi:hypothetical protein
MIKIFKKKQKSEAEILDSIRHSFVILGVDLSDLTDELIKDKISELGEIMGKSSMTAEEASRVMTVLSKPPQ